MRAMARSVGGTQRPEGLAGAIACGQARAPADAPMADAKLVVSSSVYARLLTLADQAPLDGLPLTRRTLERARTLGYNQIGQVRNAPAGRLADDFGNQYADELLQALFVHGLRPPPAQETPLDSSS